MAGFVNVTKPDVVKLDAQRLPGVVQNRSAREVDDEWVRMDTCALLIWVVVSTWIQPLTPQPGCQGGERRDLGAKTAV